MTDPMFNPETGHGIDCLCSRCLESRLPNAAELVAVDLINRRLRGEKFEATEMTYTDVMNAVNAPTQGNIPCVIRRVMTDGISTKDGLS